MPEFSAPRVALPRAWTAEAEPVEAAAPVAVGWPDPAWWRSFGSEALDAYVARARAANANLAAAAARVLQAEAQSRIAGAPLLPSLDADTGVSRDWTRTRARGGVVTTRFDAALIASYELDFFGRNRAGLLSAEASERFSRYDRDTVALTVVSDVATTYFQALGSRDRLEVARRNLAIAEAVLDLVGVRVQAGAAPPIDLARQRAAVAAQWAAIPALEVQARQAENALAILLALPPDAVGATAGSVLALTPPPIRVGLPAELLTRRPDIQAAETRLIAANAEIGVARAAFFPSVSLTGSQGYDSDVFSTLFDPLNRTRALAASLAQPIFQGGRLSGQLALSEARRIELVETYRDAVYSAFADVADALVAARRSAEQEALQAEAVEQARIAFDLAETRYRAGVEDFLSVLDAQRTLLQAEDQRVQARVARLQAAVSLFRALGGGWEVDGTLRPGP